MRGSAPCKFNLIISVLSDSSDVNEEFSLPGQSWPTTSAAPTPSPPCPSNTKSNLRKGRMWWISDYILNEGYCWLVAFIGTLISFYCNTDVGKRRGVLEKDQSQAERGEKQWGTHSAVVPFWWMFFFKPGFRCIWLADVILVLCFIIQTKS